MNIAMSFAIKKKRILVIDGDLRHGSTSSYVDSPKTGLSIIWQPCRDMDGDYRER